MDAAFSAGCLSSRDGPGKAKIPLPGDAWDWAGVVVEEDFGLCRVQGDDDLSGLMEVLCGKIKS